MIKVTNIKAIRIIGALLILLSGKAFAVTTYATQAGLNTEISNRKAADTAEVTAGNTAITTEKTRATLAERTLNTAITKETARAKAAEAAVHGPTYIVGDRDLNSPSGTVGNIVYYIDGSGEHGLEVKTTDEKFLMNYADAKIAAESYNLGGNIGSCVSNCWHLPSKTELNLLFEAQSISSIGSLSCNFYLSSTKSSSRSGTNQVWYQGFSYGEYLYGSQLSTLMCVRAVRVF